jgi:serine/threonine protein kinase
VRCKLEQFINEARTTARLDHPHIVRVWEFDLHGRIPYLVMEYAPNQTLRDRHPPGQCLSLARIVPYAEQIGAALQYIHNQGLIHRDVKPENMRVGEKQRILLGDFGISVVVCWTKAAGELEIVGTIASMAPEQIQGKPCIASDQYALGVVVYEWLTGRCPFEGVSGEVLRGHLYEVPLPLRSTVATLPQTVERIVLKALAKTPQERFSSVQEFVEALTQANLHSSASPRRLPAQRPRAKRRTQQSLLRETAGLLAASCVIGSALGALLSMLGLERESFWVLLVLMALPLLVALHVRNGIAFLLACSIVVVATELGSLFHSVALFLSVSAFLSFLSIAVTFSLGIRDELSASRK